MTTLRSGEGEVAVHAGGSACITMNQVGLATANLSQRLEARRNYPIGSTNLKYARIFEIVARHLGVTRPIVARPPAFFLESARRQAERLQQAGKEAAYDPLGLLEIEDADLYIDPLPSMQALGFGSEDIVSKAAITRWVRTHAASPRWAGQGISMNLLAPGVVMTELIERDMKDPRKAAGIHALPRPLGRVPGPESIAPLVKFLLVDDARFIVGQFLVIDGGVEAAWRGQDAPRAWEIGVEEFRRLLGRPS